MPEDGSQPAAGPDPAIAISDADVEAFQRDGVLHLQGVFAGWVETLQRGIERNMAAPSWRERTYKPDDSPTRFFQDFLVWDWLAPRLQRRRLLRSIRQRERREATRIKRSKSP